MLGRPDDGPAVVLGRFRYDADGPTVQTFEAFESTHESTEFPAVTLRVTANHGHPDYTCVYRFRVHGEGV